MSVNERIAKLRITLPEVTPPVAAFVTFVRSANQIFVSGDIAKESGKPRRRRREHFLVLRPCARQRRAHRDALWAGPRNAQTAAWAEREGWTGR
jgi:hypothetical protein